MVRLFIMLELWGTQSTPSLPLLQDPLWPGVVVLYRHLQHHNDTIIKTHWQRQTQEVFFNKILPLTLLQGFEKVVWGFTVRRSWRPNINCNILTPLLWPSRCLSCSLGLLNRRPRAHSAGCWLSLLHLISIFSGPQTPSGFPRAPSVGCGFTYHNSSPTVWNSTGNSTSSSNSTELYNRSTPTRSLKSNF